MNSLEVMVQPNKAFATERKKPRPLKSNVKLKKGKHEYRI